MKRLLLLFLLAATLGAAGRELINSDIVFNYHLQGVAADETGIYWSFTDTLVKTDYNLKLLKKVTFENYHGGDLCAADGYIYWSMLIRNSKLIAANNNSRAAVWQFNRDLELVKKYTLPVKEGIDGITFYKGKFYVAPAFGKEPQKKSAVDIFDRRFKFLKRVEFSTDSMKKFGIQTLNVVNGLILAAFYDDAQNSPLLDPETFQVKGFISLRPNVGTAKVPSKIAGNDLTWLVGRLKGKNGDWKCSAAEIKITPDFKVVY